MAHLNQRRPSPIPSFFDSRFDSRISRPLIFQAVALGVVLILAAWLRWYYILHVQPYPDEFVTLLAVKMILQKGLPLLPSGLFYDHGLLFSYAGGLASALFGFSREAVRATSLVFDLLTVLLIWHVGRRWFSAEAGLAAATLMAVAPTAVLWGGRARMYALLQLLVLLTLYFAFAGANPLGAYASRFRRLALFGCLGATLTQFVSIALIPPLALGTVAVGWLQARQTGERPWFRSRRVWWEIGGLAVIVLAAFLVKRMGQPKSIAPLQLGGGGILTGIAQVVAIYGAFSTDLAASWNTLAPFFTAPEAIGLTLLALLGIVWCGVNLVRRRASARDMATLFLALILAATTVEMIFFVAPDRRDDKYLVMLLPALFLLAADGATRLFKSQIPNLKYQTSSDRTSQMGRATSNLQSLISGFQAPILGLIICLLLIIYNWPFTSALLARTGSDYDTAFGYVRDHWKPGDAILTGTPAAAAIYLGRSDYYAVEGSGGYAYRIMQRDGQPVDRWLGSPWLETDEQLRAAFDAAPRVWLVLERWGLIKEYYSPLTMQRILAMTDFVREDNGVIVLRSRPAAALIPEIPSASLVVNFDNQLALQGYDLAWQENGPKSRQLSLVLYWQPLSTIPYDYTVFVHLRDAAGRNVAQADHQPLTPVYPPTLWPVGQTIRERSVLTLPEGIAAGTYNLWIGLYRLDTLERLPVAGGPSSDNAVSLGEVAVR
jgi:4-amino-4-deoxy-L-arabinose transferase-like glycosyltransferase